MKFPETSLVLVVLLALSAGVSCLRSSSSFSGIAKQVLDQEELPIEDDNGAQEYLSQSGNESNVEWDPICPLEGSGAVCLDCSQISVCLRGKVLPARDCPKDVPYCVNSALGGYCSAKPDEEREGCRTNFQCSSEGYFPDPHNCNFFYLCDSDFKATKYDCMPGYMYDMVQRNCRRQTHAQECKKLDCGKSNGVWVYYESNKQYYGYCYQTETASEEVVLFKCSDGSEFDGQQCQFKCRAEGKFADTQDYTRYFECYYVGFTLYSRVKACPKGMVFDTKAKFCLPSRGMLYH
ncbi:uncharacterized protein LOC135711647 [Ochlerotatus camptorhynchus]|uniref:uncharacterized protein LOC135711647 n=1 Tax=Ochlerotatus camptorhynchus TaxID=644619 RepID=UPI0031D98964